MSRRILTFGEVYKQKWIQQILHSLLLPTSSGIEIEALKNLAWKHHFVEQIDQHLLLLLRGIVAYPGKMRENQSGRGGDSHPPWIATVHFFDMWGIAVSRLPLHFLPAFPPKRTISSNILCCVAVFRCLNLITLKFQPVASSSSSASFFLLA